MELKLNADAASHATVDISKADSGHSTFLIAANV
jgi:hypothetical protein